MFVKDSELTANLASREFKFLYLQRLLSRCVIECGCGIKVLQCKQSQRSLFQISVIHLVNKSDFRTADM